MIVVDASVANPALLNTGTVGDSRRAAMAVDRDWAAPAGVLYAELLEAIAATTVARKVTGAVTARADWAAEQLAAWTIREVPAGPLLARAWELRHNVSMYDALYVAAAEHLGCPLLTADARLTRASGPRCEFRLVP